MAAIKLVAGNYTCNRPIRVIKKIEYKNKMNSDGTVARTHGTWTKPENFYYFTPGQKTKLTEEDLKNPSLQNMILSGSIFRTL